MRLNSKLFSFVFLIAACNQAKNNPSSSIISSKDASKTFLDYCKDKNASPKITHTVKKMFEIAKVTYRDCDAAFEILKEKTRLQLTSNLIEDISPISGLNKLVRLEISGAKVKDISPIATLSNLHYLDLSGNQIENISALSNLKKLTMLYLSDNSISDIMPLNGLEMVEALSIANNNISNLEPLRNMTQIWQHLDLSGNSFSENAMESIEDLTKLRNLSLGNNNLTKLLHLDRFWELSSLELDNNNFTEIPSLKNFPNLLFIDLSNNEIEDIKPLNLSENIKLSMIDLSFNKIRNIDEMASIDASQYFSTIEEMHEAFSKHFDSPLPKKYPDIFLNFSHNNINSIQALSKISPAIKVIELNDNSITDFSPLTNKFLRDGDRDTFQNNPIIKDSKNCPHSENIPNISLMKFCKNYLGIE
ncbi:MAG: leucine-rich repeat domain-containing protein [Oligoflexales bacterium]|nr:leucine-rich repeat domain-containing protein [Oligoflexales bacterium]